MLRKLIPSLLTMVALLLAAVTFWPGLASAQFTPSKCGVEATGKRADGTTWTGTAPRMFVGRDGMWHICQPWVPDGGDPEMKEPLAKIDCLGRETYEEWEVAGAQCSSLPPGAYTGVTDRLRPTADGRVRLIRDEWGPVQGMAIYRCVAGKWRLEGAVCAQVQ